MSFNPYLQAPIPNINNLANIDAISLGLKQISGFEMVGTFSDSSGTKWRLVKSASDSGVEIPDPALLQVTDYWCHEFPGSSGRVYIYVVEGIKQPRTENEKPVSILYQWFSTYNNPSFTPQMISKSEWLTANVYASEVKSSRISKLNALCRVSSQNNKPENDSIDISLIGGNNDKGTATRQTSKSNPDKYTRSTREELQ